MISGIGRTAGPGVVRIALLLVVIARSARLSAQAAEPDPHTAQPQRPTVANHAGTVATGWLEIEAGIELDRYDTDSHGGLAPMLAKIGLAPRVQLELQAPLVWVPEGGGTGVGDFSAGVKFRVADDAPIVGDLAILPSIKMPTGSIDVGTGTGTTDVAVLIISTREFGPVTLAVNAGYTHRSGDGTRAPRYATVWTASFSGPVHGRLGWGAELYGYPATPGPAGGDSIVAILAGPTITLQKWLVVDFGVIEPISGPQPHAFLAGLTYNVGRLWK